MEHKQDVGHRELRDGSSFETTEEEVTFFHDFIAGGIAGSCSVVIGHPFDTIKVRRTNSETQCISAGFFLIFLSQVRLQTSAKKQSLTSLATSYGGVGSLFRGMAAPLSAACVVNALIFSTFGWSSRIYDSYVETPEYFKNPVHDSSLKAFTCGSFAGFVQALVICPMEHIKCRLQVQHGKGTPDNVYKGPLQATRSIFSGHGISGLYRGWWCTAWREVPAFGLYFTIYDFSKDQINTFFAKQAGMVGREAEAGYADHSHTWVASALAGGVTGASTWAVIYPLDIIKTKIQTAPIDTPMQNRRMLAVGRDIVRQHGWRHLFRGLNITMIRAFPVNGIIFPVYEYILMHITALEHD